MKKKIFAAAALLSLSYGTASAQIVPELKTGNQKVDNTFKLSVEILYRNTKDNLITAGGEYGGEWTRDCSINSWNAASLLNPPSAETSLWAVTTDNRQYIGHQDWDQIIWVTGAYDYFEKTGDRNFLNQAYETSKNTMARLESNKFDSGYGLFMGPSVFNDGIAGYPEPVFKGNQYGTDVRGHNSARIKCLSTNTIYYNAYLLLAKMANYKGDTNAEKSYLKKAANLRGKIREHLLHGNKFYYLIDEQNGKHDYQEALGIAYAVLFGVVDKKEAQDIINNAYKGNYGTPTIYPHFSRFNDDRPGRHNKIVWPFVSAFFGSAANHAGVGSRFSYEINSLSTLCQGNDSKKNGNQTFYEIYNEISGKPDGGWQCGSWWGSSVYDQTWSATGFIRLILTDMLGMRFNGDGLTFDPNIDIINEYGFQEIKKVTYRGGTLNITKSGNGNKLIAVKVNGKEQLPVTPIAPAAGERNIELVFGNDVNLSSKYVQVDIEAKGNAYWNSAGSFNNGTGNSNGFVATKIFSRDDLPTGTVILVDNDYQYRPEAWETNNSTTDPRPETQYKSVTVSDEWWSYYGYRGFNVSKVNGGDLSANDAKNHFRVYLPKVLGDGGDFNIINKNSGRTLAIANDSQDNSAKIQQKSGTNSDVWTFEYAGNGYYYIINKNSGKALDVPGGSADKDVQPGQYDRNNNRNQQWNIIDLGGGTYRISPKCAPKLALDVVGESKDDGANVVQWTFEGKNNEIWYIQALPEIIPYVSTDYNNWDQVSTLTVATGANIWIGPWAKVGDEQGPFVAGTWEWTGPNGFYSNNREININNIQDNQFGSYVATFTSENGQKATYTLTVNKNGAVAPVVDPETPVDPTPSVPTSGKKAYRLASGNKSLFGTIAKVYQNDGVNKLGNGKEVVLWDETDVAAQQWFKVDAGNGRYRLQNVYTGLFLTNNGGLKQTSDKNDNAALFSINGNNVNINGTNYNLVEVAAQDEYTPELRERVSAGFLAQFLQYKGGSYTTITNGGWGESESLEVLLDAYETTRNPQYITLFKQCYDYFKVNVGDVWNQGTQTGAYGYGWFGYDYNDDVMWHIILAARAFKLTGDRVYLEDSRRNFDLIWNRSYLGYVGLLRWAEAEGRDRNETNSCVNGPAEVAACYIAEGYASLNDNNTANTYWNRAKTLYSNQRIYLADMNTGEVYDNVKFDGETTNVRSQNKWTSSYNQGTMLGAATLLHKHFGDNMYKNDAKIIYDFTVGNTTKEGLVDINRIIQCCEGMGNNDLVGFKGILMRYVRNYYEHFGDEDAREFLVRNAFQVYNTRNTHGFGLTNWRIKSPEDFQYDGKNYSQSPFSAITMMSAAVNAPIYLPVGDAQTFEVENMILGGEAAKQTDARASNGTYVNGIGNNANNKATFTYNAAQAGKYAVEVYYITDQRRKIQVSANGKTSAVTCCANGAWDGYAITPIRVLIDLNAGQNTITLGNTEGWGPNLDKVVVTRVEDFTAAQTVREGGVLEAEDAELNGNPHIEYSPNASKYVGVGNIGNAVNTVTFHYNATEAGEYEIAVHYSSGLDRSMFSQVNGGTQNVENYPKSGNSWDYSAIAVKTIKVQLKAGENTIKFGNATAGQYAPDLDYIVITPLFDTNPGDEPSDPTIIEKASVEKQGDYRIYNLNGQAVTTLRKGGIYIRNGKKFIVR